MERNWARINGSRSLWFMAAHIIANPVLHPPLHKDLCDWVDDWGDNHQKIILLPRGHVKSNIVCVAYPIVKIVRDFNTRQLIGSHKDKDAEKFCRTIRTILRSDRFQYYYPEVQPDTEFGRPKVWNNRQILIRRDSGLVENTVEITSIKQQVTGRHYDHAVLDDLVTPTNIGTSELREKTEIFHQLCASLLDPGSSEIVSGTRYHYQDEYGRILEDNAIDEQWDVYRKPVLHDISVIHEYLSGERKWKKGDDEEQLIYPIRYTLDDKDYVDDIDPAKNKKSVIRLYLKQGPKVFANQYMLEPFDPSQRQIHEGLMEEIPKLPTHETYSFYRCCDLSGDTRGVNTAPSFTVIITAAVTETCDLIITDIFWGTYTGVQTVRELIDGQKVAPHLVPKKITMEKGPWERSLKPFAYKQALEEGAFLPIKQMTGTQHNRTKEEHIEGLMPWLLSGKVKYVRGCRNIHILKEEMNKYGAFDRVDCLDALAQLPLLVYPFGSERFLKAPVATPEEKSLVELLNEPEIVTFGQIKKQLLKGGRPGIIGNHNRNRIISG